MFLSETAAVACGAAMLTNATTAGQSSVADACSGQRNEFNACGDVNIWIAWDVAYCTRYHTATAGVLNSNRPPVRSLSMTASCKRYLLLQRVVYALHLQDLLLSNEIRQYQHCRSCANAAKDLVTSSIEPRATMSLLKHGAAYTKPATALEIVFRCLGVTLFLVFIFVVVPKLGPTGIQHCKTAVNSNLETLEDLQNFLQLLAEEHHAHDAEKAKHLLSLAQQIGGSSVATAGNTAGRVSTDAAAVPAVPGTSQPSVGSVSEAAVLSGSAQQQQQQQQHHGVLVQQLQRSQADLAAARKVIQKHEELLQVQLQESAALRAQLHKQQQVPGLPAQQAGTAAGTAAAADDGPAAVGLTCDAAAVHALAMTGSACGVIPGVEWGGAVVIWGAEHKTATAAECCAACLAHAQAIARGVGSDKGKDAQPCNAWVYCSDAKTCGGRFQECWLKHDSQLTATSAAAAAEAAAAGAAGGSMWTSGVPAAGQPVTAWQMQNRGPPSGALTVLSAEGGAKSGAGPAAVQGGIGAAGVGSLSGLTAATAPVLLWETHLGAIRVKLLPEVAPSSVRELIRMGAVLAVTSNGRCSNCRIYRAEPGFLVQGIVEAPGAYVAVPRHPNPPQRKVMQRGLVCWAGGGGGPDWFVNMIDQSGFGDDHLCFGQVDEAGLAVFERILQLPVIPKGGAESVEMVLLQQDVRFTFTLEGAQGGM